MNDFKIARAVRLILTRLRIDTTHVVINTSRGTLTLSGRFQYQFSMEGRSSELSFELLHELDRQLKRMDEIKQVEYVLDNWSHNSDGHWTKKTAKKNLGSMRGTGGWNM